ncbi:MAG: SIMPL domain-containing protein [Desulfobulbaceae bacterium]|nr:SIMPL domain-containing protein [Desulfobulbaceae bacterium]
MLKKIVLGLMIMAIPSISIAQQPLTYDRVNFSVSVKEEVENDTVTAILYAQREGSEASALADKVNKDITWAVGLAKEVPALKVQTKDYHTIPVYSKQTLTGWRVRQSISLETQDTTALSELLGQLQQRVAIQSISYSISPERRQTVEKQLISEALSRFKERAEMVTGQLNRPDFRIVNLDINTGGESPVRPMARASMMMAAEASPGPPTLETGTDILSVTVHGTIELQVR